MTSVLAESDDSDEGMPEFIVEWVAFASESLDKSEWSYYIGCLCSTNEKRAVRRENEFGTDWYSFLDYLLLFSRTLLHLYRINM